MGLKDHQIGFIGGGHITEIIVSNLTSSGRVVPRRLMVSDPVREKLENLQHTYGIAITEDNLEVVLTSNFVFINVLPHAVGEVLEALNRNGFPPDKVIISLAAGVPVKTYEVLGRHTAVVRALPNPPSQIGMGIAAIAFNPHVPEDLRPDILELFSCLGEYVVVREEQVNTVMALSSPAITYLLFQSLIEAGVREGIDRKTSTKIVYQTIAGAMEVWKRRQVSANELIGEASTPGGISVESLYTLERYAFKGAVMEAIHQAIAKAELLGRSLAPA